ncbi:MAG: SDR family oxidoreductase [Acidimicrobiia bacterium]|nr:SDR family oxidoreductase [Acidimicrobiia bacterium]
MDVDGKIAVITGGASGIGRSTALELARRGADIVVADVNDERIAEVQGEVEALGRRYLGVHCDVTNDADIEHMRDAAISTMGQVDIVMSNAGVAMIGPPEGLSMAEWDWILQINLYGVIRNVRAFLPHLLERGSGHVVNTASVAGLFAYSWDHPTYITAKFAVVGFTEALALYLKPLGIGVTLLTPGLVETNMGETARLGGVDDISRWIREIPLETPVPADAVGVLVADAISADRYHVMTHPAEASAKMRARGQDLDAFVASQIALLPMPPNLYREG